MGGSTSTTSTKPSCGAVRETVRGWWSFDESLESRSDLGKAMSAIGESTAVIFTDGIASGHALDVAAGAGVEVYDDAPLNVTSSLTLSAFVRGPSLDGRILDRITAGGIDGYLLDVYQGRLRMIVGSRTVLSINPLSGSSYLHVVGVFSGGVAPSIRLYVDGVLAGEGTVDAGDIPTNSLGLRVGLDQAGNNHFTGQIDEPMVISRALSEEEIVSLRTKLLAEGCSVPEVNSPPSGTLLEHDASGTVQSGSNEHVRSNIRRAGDLRVLHANALYRCDWNWMNTEAVSNCQVWAPFSTYENTDGNFAPSLPLEWRLLRFNTTGLVDDIAVRIETSGQTHHTSTTAELNWFGRDTRVLRYAVDGSGIATAGSLAGLGAAIETGEAFGMYIAGWKYALPQFTFVLPTADGHYAGLDPWHISADYGSVSGELIFQNDSYHFGVWFDTTGYWYASRWNLGGGASISDSFGVDAAHFVTEPGWTEVYANDGAGAATFGTKQALIDAVKSGARLRVAVDEGQYDCGVIDGSGDVYCTSYDAYVPVVVGRHVQFDSSHSRRLRRFSTTGTVTAQNWADHSSSLVSYWNGTGAVRWFVQTSGWRLALKTNASGAVMSGSVADLVAAIRAGADVAVGRLGEGMSLSVCDSVRVADSPARAACLKLSQRFGVPGTTIVPGYYEAKVFNSGGTITGARVDFGSTESIAVVDSNSSLAWFVRQ
jgi:hypothetical protein